MAQLFYLMGASGVGKDSLLFYLQNRLAPTDKVMLPRRYITRRTHPGSEPHIEVTQEKFDRYLSEGKFAMHWRSHGYAYAIGTEIDGWLRQGYQVVINGSRHYLSRARQDYPDLIPVLVTVSHDQLAHRLIRRGRENEKEIGRRLLRAEALDRTLDHDDLFKLRNDGPLSEAGDRLLKLILGNSAPTSTHITRHHAKMA